ncbi:MAG: hemolysin III family protein [Cystobacterineae bacterium]|nr:hemolysin III family protein [Cystobacterineae bacterium]
MSTSPAFVSSAENPVPLLLEKPKIRGVIHQWAALCAFVMGIVFLFFAPFPRAAWGVGTFAASLSVLFLVSALYHRIHWKPHMRQWMRRADHASIFLLIAGTYTPMALMAFSAELSPKILIITWGGALLGMLQSLFWIRAPKVVSALLALLVGWSVVPYLSEFRRGLGELNWWLVLAGGLSYTLGAIFYAAKRPRLSPRWFGYHEVFHSLTVVAASLHAIAIWRLMRHGAAV